MSKRPIKILTIVGARPQFVKMAVVSSAIRKQPGLTEVVIHTGQHFDAAMSQAFFDELELAEPEYQLGIAGTGSADVVAAMRDAIVAIIAEENPDWVMVYGDTYSTRAGAEAAAAAHVPLAHVEAGLRSNDPQMPEEQNRRIADRLSQVLFAPTHVAVEQLEREGLDDNRDILQVGDVMMDAVQSFEERASSQPWPEGLPKSDFLLCTIHRAATTDHPERLAAVAEGLNLLAAKYPVILPLHPRTQKQLARYGISLKFPTHPPQSYFTMLQLLRHCRAVVTDSGGLQKEAFFSKKFCVTVREETEWTELVSAGYNVLVGTDTGRLVTEVDRAVVKTGSFAEAFYGDGNAAARIAAYFAGA